MTSITEAIACTMLTRRVRRMIGRRIAKGSVASLHEITQVALARYAGRFGETVVRSAVRDAFFTFRPGRYRAAAGKA